MARNQDRPSTAVPPAVSPRRAALIELSNFVSFARLVAWAETAKHHPELRELAALALKLWEAAQRADDAVKNADEADADLS